MPKITNGKETSKPAILAAAVSLARAKGLLRFSRIEVANDSGVGESTVSYHFGTMFDLRKAVVQHAVDSEILSILADVRSCRESFGIPMNEKLREKIAEYISR